jgi:cobalt-zinc-cadmium efflux system membrane fusion protein
VNKLPLIEEVEANGLIEFSPKHYVRVSSRTNGTLWRIEKQLGDLVKPGDLLAIVEAPQVGNLKADLLRSMTQLAWRRETVSRFQSVGEAVAEKQLMEARAAEREAHVNLLNAAQLLSNHGADVDLAELQGLSNDKALEKIRYAGIPEKIVAELSAPGMNSSLVAIKCPLEGVVIQRNGAAGETIETGKMLFEVADPRQMVFKMDVRREGASKILLGQKVNFQVDGAFSVGRAEITWIGVEVNEITHTVEARGNIEVIPEGGLKAHAFARCRIETAHREALQIPHAALHASEFGFVAFKRKGELEFEVVTIQRGTDKGEMVEVLSGLAEGDVVATEGSHALWSAYVLQRSAE